MNPPSSWNKPPRSQQCCGNCSAFMPNLAQNPKAGNPRPGSCHAAPPGIMQVMGQSVLQAAPVPMMQGVWAPTDANLWCRQWEPVEAGPEEAAAS